MPYQVVYTEETEFLKVEISGVRTRGNEVTDAIETLALIADKCREKRISKILAISNLTGHLPTMAAFNMAQHPEGFRWDRTIKLAFVNLSKESKKEILLAETVAVNRGYKLTKIFDNEAEAKAWLLQS